MSAMLQSSKISMQIPGERTDEMSQESGIQPPYIRCNSLAFQPSQDTSIDDESDSALGADPGSSLFSTRSPYSSSVSSVPPSADDWDRTLRHIGLQEFGKGLQNAALAIFPNDTASRYNRVHVLLISWKTQDPKLPVACEIIRVRSVFEDVYHYDVEEFQIPDEESHADVSEKINAFVKLNKNSKDDLKIVYYAGHGRLSRNKELIWSALPEKKNRKSPLVMWSGIQRSLEMAKSDTLILLDCCSSGVDNVSDGNGVTEIICACGFDGFANGVGPYSFTYALTTELQLLSKKRAFTVGELYSAVYTRMQSHMIQGVANERYPPPVHFTFAPDWSFFRSISLSILEPSVTQSSSLEKLTVKRSETRTIEAVEYQHLGKRRRLGEAPILPSSESGHSLIDEKNLKDDPESEPKRTPGTPGIPGCQLKDSLYPLDAPRALFLVRFREDIAAEDLSMDLFKGWMSLCPAAVDEIRIEASYKCFSTLVFFTIPLAMQAYILKDAAIMALGPVKSCINMPAERNDGYDQAIAAATGFRGHQTREITQGGLRVRDTTEPSTEDLLKLDLSSTTAREFSPVDAITILERALRSCTTFRQDQAAWLISQLRELLLDEGTNSPLARDRVFDASNMFSSLATRDSALADPFSWYPETIPAHQSPTSMAERDWPDGSSSYYSDDEDDLDTGLPFPTYGTSSNYKKSWSVDESSKQHGSPLKKEMTGISTELSTRDHPLYREVKVQADGLYHCPWEKEPTANCQHKPEKLKCNYDKFVDSHLKPYRCKVVSCQNLRFSSTACLLRHEREAHHMHGHGDKPFLCTHEQCDRSRPGNGFPRHWNLRDHLKRVHNE